MGRECERFCIIDRSVIILFVGLNGIFWGSRQMISNLGRQRALLVPRCKGRSNSLNYSFTCYTSKITRVHQCLLIVLPLCVFLPVYLYVSICLSTCTVCLCVSVCLSICLSIYMSLSVYLSVCLLIVFPLCAVLSVYLYVSVCLPICMSLFVCLPVCLCL